MTPYFDNINAHWNSHRELQLQASRVQQWATLNKVKINWNKTQYTHAAFHPSDPPLRIEDVVLHPQRSLTYLGVTFNSNILFNTLTFDFSSAVGDVRRRSSTISRLRQFAFTQRMMTNFITSFCYAKLRYITPLLAAEVHHPPTLQPLEIASRGCMRAELQASVTTPVPLLYAGTGRPHLGPLIRRDAAKLILSSITNRTLLGQEYLGWDGTGDVVPHGIIHQHIEYTPAGPQSTIQEIFVGQSR
jgi:hypothetical protein